MRGPRAFGSPPPSPHATVTWSPREVARDNTIVFCDLDYVQICICDVPRHEGSN